MTLQAQRRAPASGASPKQLVVFVHGYGANGADLLSLADALAQVLPDAEFVAPDAPDPVSGVPGGRQWFPISALDLEEMTRGARAAAPGFNAFLDAELERTGLPDSALALVGFSQGTMLSLHAGLRRKTAPAVIVGFSGALPDVATLKDEIGCRPPVFLAHGSADPVVPVQATQMAAQTLAGLGLGVAVHITPDLPHSIGPEGLQIGAAILRDAFDGKLDLPPGAHMVSAGPPRQG